MPDDNNILDAEVVFPLKYLSHFGRSLDFPLINCEIELDFLQLKESIISEILIPPAVLGNPYAKQPAPDVAEMQTTASAFQI